MDSSSSSQPLQQQQQREEPTQNEEKEQQQGQNVLNRERSLRFWMNMSGQTATMFLHGGLDSPSSSVFFTAPHFSFFSFFLPYGILVPYPVPCSSNVVLRGTVTGSIRAADPKLQMVHLDNLKTPIGIYPHALVRTNDMIYLEVPVPPLVAAEEKGKKDQEHQNGTT